MKIVNQLVFIGKSFLHVINNLYTKAKSQRENHNIYFTYQILYPISAFN